MKRQEKQDCFIREPINNVNTLRGKTYIATIIHVKNKPKVFK